MILGTPATLAALALAILPPIMALAAPVSVNVQDKGVRTRCAEEDNVYALMTAPGVRRFQVRARNPAYLGRFGRDLRRPDFTNCHISAASDAPASPRQVTLYDDGRTMVRGVTYPSYWRPERVAVEVAGRRDAGFHLLQLFVRQRGRMQEVVVLHAADGYWRLRPLPVPPLTEATYGTSFLVGPVEEAGRPFVRIRQVTIDPKARTFTIDFVKGGQARLSLAAVDSRALTMTVALAPPAAGGPFLALRSMYVSPADADTAQLRWTGPGVAAGKAPAVGFGQVRASAFAFVRQAPSRHNTRAPDILFSGFDDGGQ